MIMYLAWHPNYEQDFADTKHLLSNTEEDAWEQLESLYTNWIYDPASAPFLPPLKVTNTQETGKSFPPFDELAAASGWEIKEVAITIQVI